MGAPKKFQMSDETRRRLDEIVEKANKVSNKEDKISESRIENSIEQVCQKMENGQSLFPDDPTQIQLIILCEVLAALCRENYSIKNSNVLRSKMEKIRETLPKYPNLTTTKKNSDRIEIKSLTKELSRGCLSSKIVSKILTKQYSLGSTPGTDIEEKLKSLVLAGFNNEYQFSLSDLQKIIATCKSLIDKSQKYQDRLVKAINASNKKIEEFLVVTAASKDSMYI